MVLTFRDLSVIDERLGDFCTRRELRRVGSFEIACAMRTYLNRSCLLERIAISMASFFKILLLPSTYTMRMFVEIRWSAPIGKDDLGFNVDGVLAFRHATNAKKGVSTLSLLRIVVSLADRRNPVLRTKAGSNGTGQTCT